MRIHKCDKTVLAITPYQQVLDGLSSNTKEASKNAFLAINGKIIAVFDQAIVDDTWYLVIESQYEEKIREHLEKYLKLARATITKEDLDVYWDLTGAHEPTSDEITIPQKRGQLILTPHELEENVDEEEFTRFRVENNIPLQGKDYDHEFALNVSADEFISYTKGCYLGQEIIARVDARSKPPKRLVVKEDAQSSQVEIDGKRVGFSFEKNT